MASSHCATCNALTHNSRFKFDVRMMKRNRLIGFSLFHRTVFCSLPCLKAWLGGGWAGSGRAG